MNKNHMINSQNKTFHIVVIVLILCLIIYPLMGIVYASIIRVIGVYFFKGAVVFIPWIVAFFGYCIGYITHVFFQNIETFYHSKYKNYLISGALIIVYYVLWIIWASFVLDSHVSSNLDIVTIQTYSFLNQVHALVTDPYLFVQLLAEINTSGTWNMHDDRELMLEPANGIDLMVFWVIEFLLMTLYPFFIKENHTTSTHIQ